MRQLFLIAFVISSIFAASTLYCSAQIQQTKHVEASAFLLERVKNDEWLLIDVRSPAEYQKGHIPGAINIPHSEIQHYVSQLQDHKNTPVIIYCRSGRRAQLAIETLKAADFSDLSHLEGDMMGWYDTGLPVDSM
ncbi:rhodanese-like domain-containing protein [Alteromonas pelagimontana]|uniref:Rhodanese-like domain-containing protein n=1 Tax=Alteromonas pelagimontana TaxID=1858656 RepID=A0A6M4MAP4_9ALTE|nr:rhodanese-like domain-containing protein [Alteromonas pelagimontana]QJR80107.1 rhodanese-like domain-containing protein [Alteromonas pelagimontana]